MAGPRPRVGDELPFTVEHMAQLQVAIKLLRRSLGGLNSNQAEALAGTLERLRDSIVAGGVEQAGAALRTPVAIPFSDPNHPERTE